MLISNTKLRNISAKLSAADEELCKAYIKGAVHSFCKNNPDQYFSVQTLFGGRNTIWSDVPLDKIYQYYVTEKPEQRADRQAGIDVGNLLKKVLDEDKQFSYELKEEKDNIFNEYRAVD